MKNELKNMQQQQQEIIKSNKLEMHNLKARETNSIPNSIVTSSIVTIAM